MKNQKTTQQNSTELKIEVSTPKFKILSFTIIGTSPYVGHAFSQKNRQQMLAQQKDPTLRGKKKREPRDIEADYNGAKHTSEEGWLGIPAGSFRSAMISACRLIGVKMTLAKLTLFVEQDGIDKESGTPLVRIYGTPEMHQQCLPNDNGSADVRIRPMWRNWKSEIRIKFDQDQITESSVANLLMRAGQQVGIGEGRHDSRWCSGCGWGTFRLAENGEKI